MITYAPSTPKLPRQQRVNIVTRKEFEMIDEDLNELLDACKPTPAMTLNGGDLICGTPQENANRAWQRLGEKMGFKHMTVEPVQSKGPLFFTAEIVDNDKMTNATTTTKA